MWWYIACGVGVVVVVVGWGWWWSTFICFYELSGLAAALYLLPLSVLHYFIAATFDHFPHNLWISQHKDRFIPSWTREHKSPHPRSISKTIPVGKKGACSGEPHPLGEDVLICCSSRLQSRLIPDQYSSLAQRWLPAAPRWPSFISAWTLGTLQLTEDCSSCLSPPL